MSDTCPTCRRTGPARVIVDASLPGYPGVGLCPDRWHVEGYVVFNDRGVRIVMWDWKEQPDIGKLNKAATDVFDGTCCPQITSVDTGSDSYAVVVSGTPLTSEETQAAYEAWRREVTA